MSDISIRVEGLSKQYEIGATKFRYYNLPEQFTEWLKSVFQFNDKPNAGKKTIWALKDVSFEVERGEIVGVIGRNAAGKSTLLKILSRITEPTVGFAEIHGRVGSMLEVGTGFHPELTGRENIYLNGVILGMKKTEIDRKFDEIVAFSEVEKFIDTPVKRYSSGMYVRLAFAVAAYLDPEILIIDEVLAVGDTAFQQKCLGKMEGVSKEGRTVLFVSHTMTAVEQLCQKGIVLQQGELAFSGSSKEAIHYYLHSIEGARRRTVSHIVDLSNATGSLLRSRPLLTRLELFTEGNKPLNNVLKMGAPFKACIYFKLENPTLNFDVTLGFNDMLGQRIFTAHSLFQPELHKEKRVGEQMFVCEIPSLTLVTGEYKIKVGLDINNLEVDWVEDAARLVVTSSDYYKTGQEPWNGFFVLKQHWYLA